MTPPSLLGAVPDEDNDAKEGVSGMRPTPTLQLQSPRRDLDPESKRSRSTFIRENEEKVHHTPGGRFSLPELKASPRARLSAGMARATRAKNQILARQKTANLFVDEEDLKAKVRAAIGEPEYDVAQFYKTSGWCQKLARSKYFENMTLCLIMVNAVWLAIDTDFNAPAASTDTVFVVMEHFFCAFFLCEWSLRFAAFRRTRDCIKDFWLVFDGFLMAATVIETWLMQFVLWAAGLEEGRSESSNMIRIVRLMRIVRIARIARVLHMVPELLILVKAMVVAMRAVFFSVTLLVLVLYVFGIVFTQLARDAARAETYFATVPDSMSTLLLNGIFLDNVGSVVRDIGRDNLLFSGLFMVFVLVATLTVMNMLVGILVEVINVIASVEKEQIMVQKVQEKLEQVMDIVGLSPDDRLTRWEFLQLIQQPEAARILQDVGVDAVGLFDFVGVIFPNNHATITFPALMQVVLSLRGNNLATVKDLVDLRKCLLAELARFPALSGR